MARRILSSICTKYSMVMIAAGALALAASASAARAQVGRRRSPVADAYPDYWVGLSLGYAEGITTTDDASGATWQFGYTAQIRATLEKTLQPGTTVGISAGYANAPLTYTSGSNFFDGCGGVCRAEADVTQYMIFVKGGGYGNLSGFHGEYVLETGATQFSNFRDQDTNQRLQPMSGSYDLTFGLGGGLSYGLTPISDVYVDEMLDFVLHHQSRDVVAQSAPRFFTLRAGFRVGF
jgi:hypothetical protein